MLRALTAVTAAALLLPGCGGGDVIVATPSSPPAEASVAPSPSPSPSPRPETSRCENAAAGYALTYPFHWSVAGGPGIEPCTFFDPQPLALEPGTEASGVGIRVDVRDVPLAQAREDTGGEQEERTVAGRAAVRATGTTTDDALIPAGTRFTTWLVDLGQRTFLITTDDAARGDDPYESHVQVLDEMAQSLEAL